MLGLKSYKKDIQFYHGRWETVRSNFKTKRDVIKSLYVKKTEGPSIHRSRETGIEEIVLLMFQDQNGVRLN